MRPTPTPVRTTLRGILPVLGQTLLMMLVCLTVALSFGLLGLLLG